jgi:2-polyprenyl-3-methyl-5-hydroxy-6-metoxy-1,4-benzoquinol methylase
MSGGARSLARKLIWPARRFFDPRFAGVVQEISDVKRLIAADTAASDEAAMFTGRSLDTLLARVNQHRRALDALNERLEQLNQRVAFDPESPHSVDDIDENSAHLLNYAASHEGFAAQAGLWFNPSLLVAYEPGGVALRWVNERIVEAPYAFRALSRVGRDAKVLDVGATESSVCLSLATLGYDVTAVDPRPNILTHERLRVVAARIEAWDEDDEAFDAVLCLSTIEHIGTSAYEQEPTESRTDLEAMKKIHQLTQPEGVLVLTTTVGKASFREGSRVYNREALDELLVGWELTDLTLVQRRDATHWATIDEQIDDLESGAETVAMITATKSVV